jgi:hypothetical protein
MNGSTSRSTQARAEPAPPASAVDEVTMIGWPLIGVPYRHGVPVAHTESASHPGEAE